jgi:hypothetical protein
MEEDTVPMRRNGMTHTTQAYTAGIAALLLALSSPAFAGHRPSEPKKPLIQQEFTGYGKTVKDAEAHALEQANEWLADHANLGWTPSTDYLRDKNMVHFGEPSEEVLELAGPVQVVKMQLEINSDQARQMQQKAREARMTSRHLLLAKVLGGLVSVFLVAGGYLRLEEATRGYYTRMLRLTAIGIVLVVGIGLLMVA